MVSSTASSSSGDEHGFGMDDGIGLETLLDLAIHESDHAEQQSSMTEDIQFEDAPELEDGLQPSDEPQHIPAPAP